MLRAAGFAAMTIASLAMALWTLAGIVAGTVAYRRRGAHRWSPGGLMALSCVMAVVGAVAMVILCTELTHGSELSNLGDGLLMLLLIPAHLFGWPIAGIVLARKRARLVDAGAI